MEVLTTIRKGSGLSPGSYISPVMTHIGCLHFPPVLRQLGRAALLSLIFPEGEEKAEPARGVTPEGSGGGISVP